MTISRFVALTVALAFMSAPAAAQQRCNRIATTSFEFGRTGGNLRGDAVAISVSGMLRHLGADTHDDTTLGRVPRDSVRAIARAAWNEGFMHLPTSPTRPTRNPDASRTYIDVRSRCGRHHVEVVATEQPRAFAALYSRLEKLAALARQ